MDWSACLCCLSISQSRGRWQRGVGNGGQDIRDIFPLIRYFIHCTQRQRKSLEKRGGKSEEAQEEEEEAAEEGVRKSIQRISRRASFGGGGVEGRRRRSTAAADARLARPSTSQFFLPLERRRRCRPSKGWIFVLSVVVCGVLLGRGPLLDWTAILRTLMYIC